MADPLVFHAPLEVYLPGRYRSLLEARPEPVCASVQVDRVEPPATAFPPKLLVIRDDSGPETSFLTGERQVGHTLLMSSRDSALISDAWELANIVYALRAAIPSRDPANPVAAVVASTGPTLVPEASNTARIYWTVTFAVAGRAL